jgi:hypothetical protein
MEEPPVQKALAGFRFQEAGWIVRHQADLAADGRRWVELAAIIAGYDAHFLTLNPGLSRPLLMDEGVTDASLRAETRRLGVLFDDLLEDLDGVARIQFLFAFTNLVKLDGLRVAVWLDRCLDTLSVLADLPAECARVRRTLLAAKQVLLAGPHEPGVDDQDPLDLYSCTQFIGGLSLQALGERPLLGGLGAFALQVPAWARPGPTAAT